MNSIDDAIRSIRVAWPGIIDDCCEVLGSELHYQAMIYHRLRTDGQIPVAQLGMNVPMYLANPVTPYFQDLIEKRKKRKSAYDFKTVFGEVLPIMMILESTPKKSETMTEQTAQKYMQCAISSEVHVLHFSRCGRVVNTLGAG